MATRKIPSTMKQIVVMTRGTDFRKVTAIKDVPVPKPKAGEILVKTSYVGINASDVNYSAGRYNPTLEPPFPAGLEGIGNVVEAGENSTIKEGQFVAYSSMGGSFAEYIALPSAQVIPVPSPDPAFISISVSGLTASISLEKEADLKEGKTVLVTAAAGGTGQFAVQLAKLAGCHVIGTCSSAEKVDFLKSIGCDRPVNYKEEKLDEVLTSEYPNGLDVVYESIGKDMFDTSLKHIAFRGRLIVIGMISGYNDDSGIQSGAKSNIPLQCLQKSARVAGFFLPTYRSDIPAHIAKLIKLYMEKKISVAVDTGPSAKPFNGLGDVADAIDYMFSGKNVGKLVVNMEGEKSAL